MIKHALFVRLEAKPGKEKELAQFLQDGLVMAQQEARLERLQRAVPKATSAAATGSSSSRREWQHRCFRTHLEPRHLADLHSPRTLRTRENI
jgi:hypothetical protein